MAKRHEIAEDIKRRYGVMLNIRQATEALGWKDPKATKKFLFGLGVCNMGKERKYLAIDVARRIDERSVEA